MEAKLEDCEKKKAANEEAKQQLEKDLEGAKEQLAQTEKTNAEKDEEIARLTNELKSADENYQHLKIAKFVEISDGDIKNAKLRMTRLVREINRCIGLLNAEEVAVDEQGDDTKF